MKDKKDRRDGKDRAEVKNVRVFAKVCGVGVIFVP